MRPFPGVGRASGTLPERPSAALVRPRHINGTTPSSVVEYAVSGRIVTQCDATADLPRVHLSELFGRNSFSYSKFRDLAIRHPHVPWRARAAMSAHCAFEAQAARVPFFGRHLFPPLPILTVIQAEIERISQTLEIHFWIG